MLENWFTNKCTAYVGDDGRALSGPALEAARHDPHVKRCGHRVKRRAKFCSKCGAPAPGGWWKCGNCAKWIGNNSATCPHCGKAQDIASRINIADGIWRKGQDVFAQKFDPSDVSGMMSNGLNISEGQCAVLLDGGAVADVLQSGHYDAAESGGMKEYFANGKNKSFVMVELKEVELPVMIASIFCKDEFELDMTCSVVIAFDHKRPVEFIANVMGAKPYAAGGEITAALGYDDVARFIIDDIDAMVRSFCARYTIDQLFKDASLHIDLENEMAKKLEPYMNTLGLTFIRLKGMDFKGAVFEHLRKMHGGIEAKRREIEFEMRADELACDAVKRKAVSENEMEDFINQLAQEKKINDCKRAQEMARLEEIWKYDRAKAGQDTQNTFEIADVEHDEKIMAIRQTGEIERRQKEHAELIRQRIAEQNASLTSERINVEIQKMKVAAEQEATRGWVDIQLQKQQGLQSLENERVKAYAGIDAKTLAAAIDDPNRGDRIAKIAELEIQQKMSPELLLAAAAARGIPEAASVLSKMNAEQVAAIERSKAENREVYEKMLALNERMFNQAAESIAKENAASNSAVGTISKNQTGRKNGR